MSLLVFGFRKYWLIQRRSELNYSISALVRKLGDLQRYSANIGDGTISMQNMMNMPSSLFNRAVAFMAVFTSGSYARSTAEYADDGSANSIPITANAAITTRAKSTSHSNVSTMDIPKLI